VDTAAAPLAPAHPFAAFGPGPYRLISVQDAGDRAAIQDGRASEGLVHTTNICGGSCDHCGTAIWVVYQFRAANGAEFKVGEDCAEKAYGPQLSSDDYATRAAAAKIKAQVNKAKRERKAAKDAAKIEAADAWIGEHREALDALPHPRGFDGLTLLDWLRWTFGNAGTAGTLKACKAAYAALGEKMPGTR
jgi:hypothetical protein